MAGAGEGPVRRDIRPSVWRIWEEHTVPHLPGAVVDAMEALPPEALTVERRFLRPPLVFEQVAGSVLGGRFRVLGVRRADGKWLLVTRVAPV